MNVHPSTLSLPFSQHDNTGAHLHSAPVDPLQRRLKLRDAYALLSLLLIRSICWREPVEQIVKPIHLFIRNRTEKLAVGRREYTVARVRQNEHCTHDPLLRLVVIVVVDAGLPQPSHIVELIFQLLVPAPAKALSSSPRAGNVGKITVSLRAGGR
jgi:hypothetical protein